MDKPIFIISLDVELLWGYLAYPQCEMEKLLKQDSMNGRGCTDTLLNIFEKYDIPATWAIVGQLLLDDCENGLLHKNLPRFKDGWYSCQGQNRLLFNGKDIIDKISSSQVDHEIGYHSFSHIVFSECNREVAEAEIKMCNKLAKEFGITFKSFVFPENKIGHVDILKKYGFKTYRGVDSRRATVDRNILVRKFNAAINLFYAPPVEPIWMNGIWEIPGSMFFCDPQFSFSILQKAKIGLNRTIKTKKVFHIWLHPHNLLLYPSLKDDLDNFLGIVANKRDEGIIEVMTMGMFGDILNEGYMKYET